MGLLPPKLILLGVLGGVVGLVLLAASSGDFMEAIAYMLYFAIFAVPIVFVSAVVGKLVQSSFRKRIR